MGRKKNRPQTKWQDGALQSEYVREYNEKKAAWKPPVTSKSMNPYDPFNLPLEGVSQTTRDFGPKQGVYTKADKANNSLLPHREFQGQSTYKDHHGQKEPTVSKIHNKLSQKSLDTNYSGKFYSNTSNKDDYPRRKVELPESHKPEAGQFKQVPFQHGTSYSDDYRKWNLQAKNKRPDVFDGRTAMFAGNSIYNRDYTEKQLPNPRGECMDRPWNNCESCIPSMHGDDIDDVDIKFYEKASGMALHQTKGAPYSTGGAQGNTKFEGKTTYQELHNANRTWKTRTEQVFDQKPFTRFDREAEVDVKATTQRKD